MGLFDFFAKNKIENENKTKPFHLNSNDVEIKDWFSRTRPWNMVSPNIIDSLIKLYGDNVMFEVFVITSMENNLVKEYEEIGKKDIDPNLACSIISGILFRKGAQSSSLVNNMLSSGSINQNKLSKAYENAMNLLESSVFVDKNQIDAYVQLAGLRGILNKDDDALKYIRQGLEVIRQIKEESIPFHESSIPDIQDYPQHLDDTEKMLLAMEHELSQNDAVELDDIDRRAQRYHDQIDAQIESSYKFLRGRFGEENTENPARRYSLKTLSVFAVHIATLVAIKREFPKLHRSALNGFTRTLSFRTPNTMPNVEPPDGVFVSYCSDEESFMHAQTETFEQHGVEPLVRNLLQQLGGSDDDYKPLFEHLEHVADQASKTYLPHLAEE